MHGKNPDYRKFLEGLRRLKSTFSSNITEDGLNSIANELSNILTKEEFKTACQYFFNNFEKKPHKMFPEPKDFIRFHKTEQDKTWLEHEWDMWANRFNLSVEKIREYPIWRLDVAWTLGIKPWELPNHAKDLRQEQKEKLDLASLNTNKIFKKVGDNLEMERVF